MGNFSPRPVFGFSCHRCMPAHLCLIDTIGCGLEGLRFPQCANLMGPVVDGTVVPNGTKVPGTSFQVDPVCTTLRSVYLDFVSMLIRAPPGSRCIQHWHPDQVARLQRLQVASLGTRLITHLADFPSFVQVSLVSYLHEVRMAVADRTDCPRTHLLSSC